MFHITMDSGQSFAEHEVAHEAGPSAAGSSPVALTGDSSRNSTAKTGHDHAVAVYDAYTFTHPGGEIALGVAEQHIAQISRDAMTRDAAKARKEIANSDLVPNVISAVHERIAGRLAFEENRPPLDDLANIVASYTDKLITDTTLPAEHRSYFLGLVAEQCDARSALCEQQRRRSRMKAAVSGALSLPTFAAPYFAPGEKLGIAFPLSTILGVSCAGFSINHAVLMAMKGCQAKIYHDLAAALHTAPAESV